jgi:hypothetical protein
MTLVGVVAGQLTVERAMVATLKKWLPTYVVRAARRYAAEPGSPITVNEMETLLRDYTFPFRPRGVTVAKSFEDWPVDALPHVQVLSPSWTPNGGSQNGRSFKYQIQVACLVGAQDQDDTRLLRACFEDAILGLVTQQPSLGGVAAGVDIVGGGGAQFSEVSGADSRTFQGSITVFEVVLENVVSSYGAPVEVLPDEEGVPPEWPADPILEDAEVELEAELLGT